jgi:hypothetical protein
MTLGGWIIAVMLAVAVLGIGALFGAEFGVAFGGGISIGIIVTYGYIMTHEFDERGDR